MQLVPSVGSRAHHLGRASPTSLLVSGGRHAHSSKFSGHTKVKKNHAFKIRSGNAATAACPEPREAGRPGWKSAFVGQCAA